MVYKDARQTSTYNKAYYDAHKGDRAWRQKRSEQACKVAARKQWQKRVAEWERVVVLMKVLSARGRSTREIAEELAIEKKVIKAQKNKWIDFSPRPSKSLSSPLSSSSTLPARTQEGE